MHIQIFVILGNIEIEKSIRLQKLFFLLFDYIVKESFFEFHSKLILFLISCKE